jgi:hypothetical protein
MKAARVGLLLDWRAALPLALCYQQLLRGAKCFELNGTNLVWHPGFFSVQVQSSKNIPEGFDFKVLVDCDRPHCVGQFMADCQDGDRSWGRGLVLCVQDLGGEGSVDRGPQGQGGQLHLARGLQEVDRGRGPELVGLSVPFVQARRGFGRNGGWSFAT